MGDRVLVEATYNPNMPFKWNAQRIQTLPNQVCGVSQCNLYWPLLVQAPSQLIFSSAGRTRHKLSRYWRHLQQFFSPLHSRLHSVFRRSRSRSPCCRHRYQQLQSHLCFRRSLSHYCSSHSRKVLPQCTKFVVVLLVLSVWLLFFCYSEDWANSWNNTERTL